MYKRQTLEHALAYLTQSHSDLRAYSTGGGTLLYDAIVSVSKLDLGAQLGRRAMVLLTDGGDNGSKFSQKKAIEAAQRAGFMVYSVYYSSGGGDLDGLTKISKATGGRTFTVSPQLTLQQIYAAIANDMRLEYELGYVPPASKPNKYHKIDLTALNKSFTVQAREGYFTPPVSYTHLDVYKRQIISRASSGCERTSEVIEFSVLNRKCGLICRCSASSRASINSLPCSSSLRSMRIAFHIFSGIPTTTGAHAQIASSTSQ